jgi:hypothetical protein
MLIAMDIGAGVPVSHIAFADDLMLFLKATVDNAWAARKVLDKFIHR